MRVSLGAGLDVSPLVVTEHPTGRYRDRRRIGQAAELGHNRRESYTHVSTLPLAELRTGHDLRLRLLVASWQEAYPPTFGH